MSVTRHCNGDAVSERDRRATGIAKYLTLWHTDTVSDSTNMDGDCQKRADAYEDLTNGYYDAATQLYEYGWGQHFHFCRFRKGEPFAQAQARYEHFLAASIGLKPGMKVLDIGCGVGGPARELAHFAGCDIVGLNNHQYQLFRASEDVRADGLRERVTFQKGDFTKLGAYFAENTFDAAYAIEANCHAPTYESVYREIFKVLKPGGLVAVYEWCMTDLYDPSNPVHCRIGDEIAFGGGLAVMQTVTQARQAFQSTGFEIMREEDLAAHDDPIPWYYPLRGNLRDCQSLRDYFLVAKSTQLGTFATNAFVRGLELMGLMPKGTHRVAKALEICSRGLVAGGEAKIFTPMMMFVCRKPEGLAGTSKAR